MCGIAGFVNFEGHDRDEACRVLRRMNGLLVHRGPDAEGYFVDPHAALGHRRLSIIDIAGGAQPMGAEEGRVQIVFNGEIYNYLDLRRLLEDRGHRFHTRSDTEVILRGYLEWGEACVERLRGMFALAIWDARTRRLLLTRDRVGKKPLYYLHQGRTIAFASELKALAAVGLTGRRIDPEALDCYLTFGYVPSPRTIFSGVKKLPPAHVMTVSEDGGADRRYWDLSFGEPRERSLERATEEFEEILDDSVRCRLMSEVPLGAFLSGGLDSTLVVSSMAKFSPSVVTNSIGFEDRSFNEMPAARSVAQHLGTDHREIVVMPRVSEALQKIAWHLDEPLADSSAVPTWYVCQMARRSVVVALSGDGGDEGFGGYTFRYVPHLFESRIRAILPAWFRWAVFGSAGRVYPSSARLPKPLRLKTIFRNLAVGDAEAFYRDLGWLLPETRLRLYGRDYLAALRGFTPMEAVWPFYAGAGARAQLDRAQYADIRFYLAEDVLVKVDRMSMAHSLEVRCPLLDHRVLEFAATLPASLRISGNRGKLPLRRLAERRSLPNVASQPKRGFDVPAARWLREDLRESAEEIIFDGGGFLGEFLRRGEVRKMWSEHQSGARDHSVTLWGLMMLGLWKSKHMDVS